MKNKFFKKFLVTATFLLCLAEPSLKAANFPSTQDQEYAEKIKSIFFKLCKKSHGKIEKSIIKTMIDLGIKDGSKKRNIPGNRNKFESIAKYFFPETYNWILERNDNTQPFHLRIAFLFETLLNNDDLKDKAEEENALNKRRIEQINSRGQQSIESTFDCCLNVLSVEEYSRLNVLSVEEDSFYFDKDTPPSHRWSEKNKELYEGFQEFFKKDLIKFLQSKYNKIKEDLVKSLLKIVEEYNPKDTSQNLESILGKRKRGEEQESFEQKESRPRNKDGQFDGNAEPKEMSGKLCQIKAFVPNIMGPTHNLQKEDQKNPPNPFQWVENQENIHATDYPVNPQGNQGHQRGYRVEESPPHNQELSPYGYREFLHEGATNRDFEGDPSYENSLDFIKSLSHKPPVRGAVSKDLEERKE